MGVACQGLNNCTAAIRSSWANHFWWSRSSRRLMREIAGVGWPARRLAGGCIEHHADDDTDVVRSAAFVAQRDEPFRRRLGQELLHDAAQLIIGDLAVQTVAAH